MLITKRNRSKHSYCCIILMLASCLLSGCYFDVIIEEEVEANTIISFSEDINPVFKSSCVSCHDGIISYPNLTSANAYESLLSGNFINTDNAENSTLIQKLNDNHPFDGSVTNTELQKIILWINQGALDN